MPNAPQNAIEEANLRIAKAVAHTAEAIDAAATDGIHLTAQDYARWFDAFEKKVCASR
jgi:hypothetical protein